MTSTAAALDSMVCASAPLIATALAGIKNPMSVGFAYSTTGVTVSGTPILATPTADLFINVFETAGWGFSPRLDNAYRYTHLMFHPPRPAAPKGQP